MKPDANKPWDKTLQLLLAGIVALNLAPHVPDVPSWISIFSFGCVAWKVLYLTKGWPLPPRPVLWTATIGTSCGAFFSYQTFFGQDAAGGLLVLMASLKLLETNRYRDAMLVVFTSYFLLMSHLLNSQSLATTVFMIIDVLLITALMFQVHRRDRKTSTQLLRPALRLFALTVPLWILLFFVFPRFTTSVWNVQQTTAGTGFSENMDPGSISRLVDSEDTVFRAQFTFGSSPKMDQLYWRGGILTVGDGLKWSKSVGNSVRPDVIVPDPNDRRTVEYNVWQEAGFQKWIFVLDFPTMISSSDAGTLSNVRLRPGFIYEASRPLYTRSTFVSRSTLRAPVQMMADAQRAPFLVLPSTLENRVKELALKIKENLPAARENERSEERLARAVQHWLTDNGFRYTKSPGALRSMDGAEQLSEFLFETKVGFCEHYAAAFATIMRVLGVPSRVVVGFQGGVRNDLGGYFIVRKMDAHAWAEIWAREPDSPTRGRWVRVDPTELIAPLRLQLGGDYYRVDNSLTAGLTSEEVRRQLQSGIMGFIRRINYSWDVVQMRWNAFLIKYDLDFQAELLNALGFKGSTTLLLFGVVAAVLVIFGLVFVLILRRRATRVDPLVRDWRQFCEKFAALGLHRKENEGPLAFADRVAAAHPERASEIREIAARFVELRYGENGERPITARKFHQSVRRFSINSNSRPTSS